MGSSQQRENPPTQSQVSHLTSDPRYQQILRQLYANNSPTIINDFPQFQGNFRYHRQRPDVEIKRTVPVKNDLYVNKKSIQFVKKEDDQYGITFTFDNMKEVTISIYFAAIDQTNTNNITQSVNMLRALKNNEFVFPAGSNQTFQDSLMRLHLSWYVNEQLTQHNADTGYYPLIIKMASRADNGKVMYLYATLKIAEDSVTAQTVRIKIEKNGKAFIANDVYGASDANQLIEEKECAICLTEKVDTMIIPCKHMCLCHQCCADLRVRQQKCPICRRMIERFILIEQQQTQQTQEKT